MADNVSIARPYAKAVFAEAKETKEFEAWSRLLDALSDIARDAQTQALLKNPKVPEEKLNQLFVEVAELVVKELKAEMKIKLKNFIALLMLDKRLMVLPDIAALYQQLLAEQEGRVKVDVIYARSLNDETKKRLHQHLEKRFNSKVDIEYQQDDSLIGGAIIRAADWVMDGSVKGKLVKLRDSLSV